MPNHGVTCKIGSAKLCSAAIFKTYTFSLITRIYGLLHQINMYFLQIVLFPVTAILQLINFIAL